MEIVIEQAQASIPVSILTLRGDLDASNYQDVIAKSAELYARGVRDLLLDLSGVGFMSSSGIVALHSIALLLRGEKLPDLEAGWNVFHAIENDREAGLQQHIKLLNPRPRIMQTLQKTGMDAFFQVFTDRQAAFDSFH